MENIYEDYLIKYLESRGIKKVNNFYNEKINLMEISEDKIYNQLCLIKEFHNKVLTNNNLYKNILNSYTGKLVESFKINIKYFKRGLLKINTPKNDFEKMILKKSPYYLERAKNSIKEIYNSNYIELIRRSMAREEICLGNTGFKNLSKKKYIEIISLEKCCYNMVETDAYYLLRKLKKKKIIANWSKLIDEFCELEKLSENSNRFIYSLMSYPYNFIRCCNRYISKEKKWTIDKYLVKLEKAIAQDGDSLI